MTLCTRGLRQGGSCRSGVKIVQVLVRQYTFKSLKMLKNSRPGTCPDADSGHMGQNVQNMRKMENCWWQLGPGQGDPHRGMPAVGELIGICRQSINHE